MPTPEYILDLRARVGHALLLTPGAAAIIRDDQGQVLLIRRGDGRGWSLPGGMMEPGERIAESIVREVFEETGLEVVPVRVVGIYSDPAYTHITFPNGDEVHFVSTTFECKVVGGNLRADGDESLDVRYFAPDALPDPVVCDHAIRIADALADRPEAVFR